MKLTPKQQAALIRAQRTVTQSIAAGFMFIGIKWAGGDNLGISGLIAAARKYGDMASGMAVLSGLSAYGWNLRSPVQPERL